MNEVSSEPPLVRSSHPTDIFGNLLGNRAVVSRLDVDRPVETVVDHHPHKVGVWIENILNSDIAEVENTWSRPRHLRPNSRRAERTHHAGIDQIGVAHDTGKYVLRKIPDAQCQIVGRIQIIRRVPARFLIAEEE